MCENPDTLHPRWYDESGAWFKAPADEVGPFDSIVEASAKETLRLYGPLLDRLGDVA